MSFYQIEDVVHGAIALPAYVKPFIKSKEFQRLWNLKQLGVSNFIFDTATHSRANHCIGTAWLCYQLLDTLERNSDRKIDELHKKCVVLAGLLHDLGHGPFSHLWEGVVHQGSDTDWTHEQQSLKMIEHLISKNDIKLHDNLEKHKMALKLITSLVNANPDVWEEILLPQEMFITEIVSNKFCNIDVDKIDYLKRDFHYLQDNVDSMPFDGFLDRARIVFSANGQSHIGYNEEDFKKIENVFCNRANFHKNIYQQVQVTGVEQMVKDIVTNAREVTFRDLPIAEVHLDCDKYNDLDDSVLDLIKKSDIIDAGICKAKRILSNLHEGRHYSFVYETGFEDDGKAMIKTLENEFGSVFCIVKKDIPSAEVPKNIPLYNTSGELVQRESRLKLGFKSWIIYCIDYDLTTEVLKFVQSLNNNV